jgi:hypothetical protein
MVSGHVDIPELLPVLEAAGVSKVSYRHAQYHDPGTAATVCTLFGPEKVLVNGYSKLHPHDNFSRKIGRMVALRRAIEQLDVKHRRANA